jgi:hypothetical protein
MHRETHARRRVATASSSAWIFLAVALLTSTFWILAHSSNAYCESGAGGSKSQQITVVGCSQKGISWFLSSADSKEYKLTGNISELDEHADQQAHVQVSGTLIPSDDNVFPAGTIKVAAVKELLEPTAKLNPSIARSADWRKYTDQAYGIAYSVPAAFPLWRSDYQQHFETKFVDKENVTTLGRFEIPRDAWGNSNFVGGELAIYTNSKISKAAGCYELREPDADDDHSSELIYGVRYVHAQESSVPPEEFDFYHAFQNGRCYEIVFDFSFERLGAMDGGCMVPIMDPDSLVKPVLSEISYFKGR